MNTTKLKGELPLLPDESLLLLEPYTIFGYTAEQMHAYALSAVEADRAQRVPEGWPTDADLTAIYKKTNGEDVGKAQPLTTQRIFKAMRAMLASTPEQPVERKPMTDEHQSKLIDGLRRQEGWDGDGWDTAVIEAVERHHGIRE